jgi:hypothetical protein
VIPIICEVCFSVICVAIRVASVVISVISNVVQCFFFFTYIVAVSQDNKLGLIHVPVVGSRVSV